MDLLIQELYDQVIYYKQLNIDHPNANTYYYQQKLGNSVLRSAIDRFPDEKDPLVRARGPNKYPYPEELKTHVTNPDYLSYGFTVPPRKDPFQPTEDQMNFPTPYDVIKPEIRTCPAKMDYGSEKSKTDLFPEYVPGITTHYPAYDLTSPRGLDHGYQTILPMSPRSPGLIKTADRFASIPTYNFRNTAMFPVMKPSVPADVGPGYYIKSDFPHDMVANNKRHLENYKRTHSDYVYKTRKESKSSESSRRTSNISSSSSAPLLNMHASKSLVNPITGEHPVIHISSKTPVGKLLETKPKKIKKPKTPPPQPPYILYCIYYIVNHIEKLEIIIILLINQNQFILKNITNQKIIIQRENFHSIVILLNFYLYHLISNMIVDI